MWCYEKKLQYPVNIKHGNRRMAKVITAQYGGPDGEIGAALRYLSQRYQMPFNEAVAVLNDIGTEELGHFEMVGTIVYQLLQDATIDEIKADGLEPWYVDHGLAVYPMGATGSPFTAAALQSKGDPLADLHEDLAAEQKARATYDYILRLCDDPDVIDPIRFLREREVVHFQRFGETLRKVQEYNSQRRCY